MSTTTKTMLNKIGWFIKFVIIVSIALIAIGTIVSIVFKEDHGYSPSTSSGPPPSNKIMRTTTTEIYLRPKPPSNRRFVGSYGGVP
jgi:hypothetical protein